MSSPVQPVGSRAAHPCVISGAAAHGPRWLRLRPMIPLAMLAAQQLAPLVARRSWRERYRRGEVTVSSAGGIYDEIDAWHRHTGDTSMYDWLGVTREEYGLYVYDPGAFEAAIRHERA